MEPSRSNPDLADDHEPIVTAEDAAIMHKRLEVCPVQRQDPPELGRRAWEPAERFGWGRTYDAET